MALTSATTTEYSDFLTKYSYTDDGDFLNLSFAFLGALPFCDGTEDNDQIKEAQCFIAYAMGQGGFDPTQVVSGRTLVKEGLGRGAITEEYVINEDLIGTDASSMLRQIPMAYILLTPYLCGSLSPTSTAAAYVV